MSKRPAWWLPVLAKIWPITWKTAKATRWPIVGGLIARIAVPLFSDPNLDISYLPVNQDIRGSGTSYIPQAVLEKLIRASSHRVIIKKCTCRDARKCTEHPIDYGCMMLGDGAREIDERIAEHVSVDKALEHMRMCIDEGLTPMTGRVKIDNYIWGVKDRGRLLTICFCCHCCCTVLTSAKYFPQDSSDALKKLRGLEISVDHDVCTQCSKCIEECFINAISLDKGAVIHDEKLCKGCGRCVSVCESGATHATIKDVEAAVEELHTRIDSIVDYR